MKITEVTKPSENALFEALDIENDTGLLTEDLVKLVKSKNGTFKGPFTLAESTARLKALAESHGITF